MTDPIIKSSIVRLELLAVEALQQYDARIKDGDEPTYPAWVDDIRPLCAFVERAIEARQRRSAA